MAEVISTIKIRNSDGTYSDELPIGTTSNYVTVLVDGSTLSDTLGNTNVNSKGSLQKQIDDINAMLGPLHIDVSNLKIKINELSQLQNQAPQLLELAYQAPQLLSLEGRISNLESQIGQLLSLENRIYNLESRVGTLESII